ncbi:hypothetical protein [Streptomyces sp. 4N124]|uniref:hypothetical protein n=1 Tax=Streptomyces sp. 4N124 TaxID=3457420 RepID=UPI003FD68E32
MSVQTFAHTSDAPPHEAVDAVVIDSGMPRKAPAEAMHGFIVLDGTQPTEILKRCREQVRQYCGWVVFSEVASAEPAAPSADGDLRFTIAPTHGRTITALRVLVATGLRDMLPDVPGLAEHRDTAPCTARTATVGRYATSPSGSSPPAPHPSTTPCSSAN